jgi:hypothetical protein
MQDQLDNYGKIMKEKNLYLSASFTLCWLVFPIRIWIEEPIGPMGIRIRNVIFYFALNVQVKVDLKGRWVPGFGTVCRESSSAAAWTATQTGPSSWPRFPSHAARYHTEPTS